MFNIFSRVNLPSIQDVNVQMNTILEKLKRLYTGTTTVGIVCKGGLVLGADTRVTSGLYIAHKRGKKIFIITLLQHTYVN